MHGIAQHQADPRPAWKDQQNPLWTAFREATKHGKDRFKFSELFADEVHSSSPRFSSNGREQNGAPRRKEKKQAASGRQAREREEQLARIWLGTPKNGANCDIRFE